MPINIKKENNIITVFISGDIDHHTAKEMRETIDEKIESGLPTLLIMDFKDVSFMDSSGIGLVMGRYKLMQSIDGEIKVSNASSHIKKVMKLAGLDRLAVIEN